MLFNSFEFLIFLPLVFAAYWLLARQLRVQNVRYLDYLALDLPETCWYDANHLNRQGAETFTPRLAADLPTGR